METTSSNRWIRWFDQISMADVQVVGGKNASLGEMYSCLAARGVRVPNGFAITADAYWDFLAQTGTDSKLREILNRLKPNNIESLQECGQLARQTILDAQLPGGLQSAIVAAYEKLSEGRQEGIDVAVRSSATAEDLPDASFAGQQETYLNVKGKQQLLESCKRCFASTYKTEDHKC